MRKYQHNMDMDMNKKWDRGSEWVKTQKPFKELNHGLQKPQRYIEK